MDDVSRAEAIYGPLEPLLMGQMVCQRPSHYSNIPRVPLPPYIQDYHRTDDLDVDFLYINGTPFLHTKTRKLNFRSLQRFYSRGKKETTAGINRVIDTYLQHGLSIDTCHGDNEFEKNRSGIAPVHLETVARREHVPRIERSIRVIKERVRCFCHGLPFRYLPTPMLVAMLEYVVTCLNLFPAKRGVSTVLSPASIVLGSLKLDCNLLKVSFGAYAQVYDTTDNSPRPRSVGAIALRPSNGRGGYYFMSVESGKRIHSNQWTELPIPPHVIKLVESLAIKQEQPKLHNGCPFFEWLPGLPLDEDDVPTANLLHPPLENAGFPTELNPGEGADTQTDPPDAPPPNPTTDVPIVDTPTQNDPEPGIIEDAPIPQEFPENIEPNDDAEYLENIEGTETHDATSTSQDDDATPQNYIEENTCDYNIQDHDDVINDIGAKVFDFDEPGSPVVLDDENPTVPDVNQILSNSCPCVNRGVL